MKKIFFLFALSTLTILNASEEATEILNNEAVVTEEETAIVSTESTVASEVTESTNNEVVAAEEATITRSALNKTYTLNYTVTAKDNDASDLNNSVEKLVSLFQEEARRSPSNGEGFYNKILVFIKELQEAIIAGVNLLASTSTSTNDTITTINEVAQTAEAIVETLENVENAQAAPATTRAITRNIEFSLTISCENPEKEVLFETLKNKMIALSEAFNKQACSAEEFVAAFNSIIQESKDLGSSGNLTINVTA